MRICANCKHCVRGTFTFNAALGTDVGELLQRDDWRCRAASEALVEKVDPVTGRAGFPCWELEPARLVYHTTKEAALVRCASRNHDGECHLFEKAPEAT